MDNTHESRAGFVDYAIIVSEGVPGVAGGLAIARKRLSRMIANPDDVLVEIVKALGKKGQQLYDHYKEWLRADDCRSEQNPSFADYLVSLAQVFGCRVKPVTTGDELAGIVNESYKERFRLLRSAKLLVEQGPEEPETPEDPAKTAE